MNRRIKRRAAGFGLVLLVWGLAMASLMVMLATAAVTEGPRGAALARARSDYLDTAGTALEQFYRENLPTIDRDARVPWGEAEMLQRAGIGARWNLQLRVSDRQIDPSGEVAYRDFYLWLPVTQPDGVTFDAASATLSAPAGVLWRKVDGAAIEAAAVAQARKTLARLADQLRAHAAAKVAMDPEHDTLINYFQTAPCSSPAAGNSIPCSQDQYQSVSALGLTAAVGIASADATDPWGGGVEASNTVDADTAEPPYSVALRVVTPWGVTLRARAAQTL